MIHVRIQNANVEPVFFTYPDNDEINAIVGRYAAGEPSMILLRTMVSDTICG